MDAFFNPVGRLIDIETKVGFVLLLALRLVHCFYYNTNIQHFEEFWSLQEPSYKIVYGAERPWQF